MSTPASSVPTHELAHASAPRKRARSVRWLEIGVLCVALAAGGLYAQRRFSAQRDAAGVASGNGRIEAVQIDVATKTAGRVREIVVEEGDVVEPGQILARMDTTQLEAQERQAQAQLRRAEVGVTLAKSLLAARVAERRQAVAVVAQREAHAAAARRRFDRTDQLVRAGSLSEQILDDDRANADGAVAALAAARAQVAAADAAIAAVQVQAIDAAGAVDAARATVESVSIEIADSTLKAPRKGRVQLRVAQPTEVLGPGSRVLSLVDLDDVYMTFFLPTEAAGRVAIGTDVRLVLDASPQWVVPASVSFVADVAQFTPKTVETEKERQKLMFRVKARVPPELLRKHAGHVKIGLPGVAHVRIAEGAPWPAALDKPVLR